MSMQKTELHVFSPKVWLHHHIGNDWACIFSKVFFLWQHFYNYVKALWNLKVNRASCAKNKDTAKIFLLSVQEEGDSCINDSRSLRGSVGLRHTETTGAYDTRKNSPAVRGVQRWHAWKSVLTTERSGSLESSMRYGECRRETRHTRSFKKSTPTNTPACTHPAVIVKVMSVSTATADAAS